MGFKNTTNPISMVIGDMEKKKEKELWSTKLLKNRKEDIGKTINFTGKTW